MRSFSSSMLALFSLAGFFRKTFDIVPSRFVCISCLEEFGCTLIWSLIDFFLFRKKKFLASRKTYFPKFHFDLISLVFCCYYYC